jgi:hypothetical protein
MCPVRLEAPRPKCPRGISARPEMVKEIPTAVSWRYSPGEEQTDMKL